MPTYEYECSQCRHRFERRQRFDDEPISQCPLCSGKSRRVLHSVPVFFKGSGFYSTDHGRGRLGNPERERESEEKELAAKGPAAKGPAAGGPAADGPAAGGSAEKDTASQPE